MITISINQSRKKIIIDIANCNINRIMWGERSTFVKYVNSISNYWLQLVLNKAQWKKSWKYFFHVNSYIASSPSYIFKYSSFLYLPYKYLPFCCSKSLKMLIWQVLSTTVVVVRSPATQSVVFIPVVFIIAKFQPIFNKYPSDASVSLVPNLRCHNLYVCNLWWLKYDYQLGASRHLCRPHCRMKATAIVFISLPGARNMIIRV